MLNALRKDILLISLTILIMGVLLSIYGIMMGNEGVIIVSTVFILAPIPFLVSFLGKKKDRITAKDLYKDVIMAMIFVSIISLVGYFTFVTVMGKAISLAIFIGTVLSLIIDFLTFKKNKAGKTHKENINS